MHLTTSAINGGAGKSTLRLHEDLTSAGINSTLISSDKEELSFQHQIYGIRRTKIRAFLERILIISISAQKGTVFNSGLVPSNYLRKLIKIHHPDILHLHWVGAGFLSIFDLLRIKVPVVWTLCDIWPVTGGCHYPALCSNFKKGCGNCPILRSRTKNDLSRFAFRLKKYVFKKLTNITFVSKSSWSKNIVDSSNISYSLKSILIPNGIDVEFWNATSASNLIKGSSDSFQNKRILLYVSENAVKNKRKGFDHLFEAVNILSNLSSTSFLLIVVGKVESALQGLSQIKNNFEILYYGFVEDKEELKQLYSLAEVTVVPSREENLTNVAMESSACGTPVVCFDIGGNSQIVRHGKTGYLAKPYDEQDLANGIDWVLNNVNSGIKARNYVAKYFSRTKITETYISLYKKILSEVKINNK